MDNGIKESMLYRYKVTPDGHGFDIVEIECNNCKQWETYKAKSGDLIDLQANPDKNIHDVLHYVPKEGRHIMITGQCHKCYELKYGIEVFYGT